MQQQTQEFFKTVVKENNDTAYSLSAQMVQLEVIEGAVSSLLERVDDIVHKGWDKEQEMAYMAINEIRNTVRLINMGFYPLFKEMSEEIKDLNIHANELFDMVIGNDSEQSSKATTHEEVSQSV